MVSYMKSVLPVIITAILLLNIVFGNTVVTNSEAGSGNETIRIWLTSDQHCANNTNTNDPWHKYSGWEEAIAQFEDKGIDFDMCLVLGDLWNLGLTRTTTHLCAYQDGYPPISPILDASDFPFDETSGNAHDWLEQTNTSSKPREYFYCIPGNHEPHLGWSHWVNYIDPLGLHPATSFVHSENRPFPIVAYKSEETYEILVGENLRILMLGEINEGDDHSGAYSWWVNRLTENSSDNFITCAHRNYDDGEISLHYVAGAASSSYATYLRDHPSHHVNLWLGGHWHFFADDLCYMEHKSSWRNFSRKTFVPEYNCTNLNVASITHRPFHSPNRYAPSYSYLMTLTNNSKIVQIATYNHSGNCWDEDNPNAPSISPGNFTITLSEPFLLSGSPSPSDPDISISKDFGLKAPLNYTNTSEPAPPLEQPTANFTWTVDGYNVSFIDTSNDSDGTIVNWTWDFGDDNISYLQNPNHTYASDGSYNVTLNVTDNQTLTDSITKIIIISSGSGDIVEDNSHNLLLYLFAGLAIICPICAIIYFNLRNGGKK